MANKIVILLAGLAIWGNCPAQENCYEYGPYDARIAEFSISGEVFCDITVENGRSYCISSGGLLRVYDVATPDVPVLLDTAAFGTVMGHPIPIEGGAKVEVDGDEVFVCWFKETQILFSLMLAKFELNGGKLTQIGEFEITTAATPFTINSLSATNGTAFVGLNFDMVELVDTSGSDPSQWSQLDNTGFAGRSFYDLKTADERLWMSRFESGVECFDVSNPQVPVSLAVYGQGIGLQRAESLDVDGAKVYVLGSKVADGNWSVFEFESGTTIQFLGDYLGHGLHHTGLKADQGYVHASFDELSKMHIRLIETDGAGGGTPGSVTELETPCTAFDVEGDIVHLVAGEHCTIHGPAVFGSLGYQLDQVVAHAGLMGVEFVETGRATYAVLGVGNPGYIYDHDWNLWGLVSYDMESGGYQSFVGTDCVVCMDVFGTYVAAGLGTQGDPGSHGVGIFELDQDGNISPVHPLLSTQGAPVTSVHFDALSNLYVCAGDDLVIYLRRDDQWYEQSVLNLNPSGELLRRPVDVEVHKSLACVARGQAGLTVVDVHDQVAPTILLPESVPANEYYTSIALIPGQDLVVCVSDRSFGHGNQIALLDADDGSTLSVDTTPGSKLITDFYWSGRYLYASSDTEVSFVSEIDNNTVSHVGTMYVGQYTSSYGITGHRDHIFIPHCRIGYYDTGGFVKMSRECGDFVPTNTRYKNVSQSVVGLDYEGTPYSSVCFDLSGDDQAFFLSINESRGYLYTVLSGQGGVPLYANYDFYLPGGTTAQSLRGTSTADYDNNGYEDLLVCGDAGAALYANTGAGFIDVTQAQGLTSHLTHSWMAAWGDYDRDGLVDLFVSRAGDDNSPDPAPSSLTPQVSRLLRNTGSGFVDVTAEAGLKTQTSAAIAAAWADPDNDGDLDLWVGHYDDVKIPLLSSYYENQDDGTFVNQYTTVFGDDAAAVNGAVWADLDNDADLDLIVSGRTGESRAYRNHPLGVFDGLAPLYLAPGHESGGIAVLDHDLDGRSDVIVNGALSGPRVLENRAHYDGLVFLDQTRELGAESRTPCTGISVRDVNADGDPDVFLGRALATAEHSYVTQHNPEGFGKDEGPAHAWVGLRLNASGANNRSAIGTHVVFSLPNGDSKIMVVDGGSGRGTQAGRTLICGLGDSGVATVAAEIRWPGRHVQSVSLPVGQVTTVDDSTVPVIIEPSVTTEITLLPNGDQVWKFRWQTETSTDPALDRVEVTRPGSSTPIILNGADVYRAVPGGGYEHVIEKTFPCIPGETGYRVSSGVGTVRAENELITMHFGFCVTGW